MNKNRVLFIECLDYFTLIIGFFLHLFFYKVYFFNAISRFQPKKSRKFLSYFGFHWISFTGVPLSVCLPTFDSRVEYGEKILKNQLSKTFMYSFIIDHFKFDPSGIKKVEATLKRRVTEKFPTGGSASITLIKHFFGNSGTKIFYMASTIDNFLLAHEVSKDLIVPLSIHCVLSLLIKHIIKGGELAIKFIDNLFKFVKRRKPSAVILEKSEDSFGPIPNQYEIAFFPHINLHYGTFFKKTYLYSEDQNSLLYRKRLLTLFLGNTDPLSERYLKLYRIPYVNLSSSLLSKKEVGKELTKLFMKIIIVYHANFPYIAYPAFLR